MAKLKLTPQLMSSGFTQSGWEVFGSTNGFGGSLSDSNITSNTSSISRGNRLVLFKGAFPTEAELRSAVTLTVQNAFFRNADRLLNLDYTNLFNGFSDGAVNFKESPFNVAMNSGVATWFALLAWNSSTSYCNVFGDVSDLEGNGMIKLPNVNIVVGDRYNMKPLKLVFPLEFEY